MVFQIVDDILDIISTDSELGKPAGHDMVEGVYTLPVLATLAAGGAAADELAVMLGQPLDATQQKRALDIVRAGNGVQAAVDMANDYVAKAEAACNAMPQNDATQALRDAAAALLNSIR
jgi:heptaprenyl diphosphate synthase